MRSILAELPARDESSWRDDESQSAPVRLSSLPRGT